MPPIPVHARKARATKVYARPAPPTPTATAAAPRAATVKYESTPVSDTIKYAELTIVRYQQPPKTFSLNVPTATSDWTARARVVLLAVAQGACADQAGPEGLDAFAFCISHLMGWAGGAKQRLLSQLLELQKEKLKSWTAMSRSEKIDLSVEVVNEGLKAFFSEAGLVKTVLELVRPTAQRVALVAVLEADVGDGVGAAAERAPSAEE